MEQRYTKNVYVIMFSLIKITNKVLQI